MPKFDIQNRSGELILKWRASSSSKWFLLLFSVFWMGIVSIFIVVLAQQNPGMLWFVSIHFLVGLLVSYLAITMFVNRYEIRAGKSGIHKQTSPLPVLNGNMHIPADRVDQLFIGQSGQTKNRRNRTMVYSLFVLLKNGKRKTLVSMLTKAQALELERRIEDHLAIEDRVIPLSGKGMDLLRKWSPSMAEMAEVENLRQQGKTTLDSALPSSTGEAMRQLPDAPEGSLPQPHQAEPGDAIILGSKMVSMTAGEQYDWQDGSSDRRLAVYDPGNGEHFHLFCEQASVGRWTYYEERRLDDEDLAKLGLKPDSEAPARIVNGDDRFFPRDMQAGRYFNLSDDDSRPIEQRIYGSTTAKERFRWLLIEGQTKASLFIQARTEDARLSK